MNLSAHPAPITVDASRADAFFYSEFFEAVKCESVNIPFVAACHFWSSDATNSVIGRARSPAAVLDCAKKQ